MAWTTLIVLFALAEAVVARFASFGAAAIMGVATVSVALAAGMVASRSAMRAVPALAALAALLSLLRAIPGLDALWPCDIACNGGGHYQRVAGVPVLAVAAVGYAAWAMAWRRWRRPSTGVERAAWFFAGCSLYYLWLAWRLPLPCAHCLAVHVAVLGAAAASVRGRLPWRSRLTAAALAALALHAAFNPGVGRDVAKPVVIDRSIDRVAYDRADRNRRNGKATAARHLELAIDFQCPVCARVHDRLMTALAPAITDGRLQVVVRHVARPSEPAAKTLALWALAAADLSHDDYQLLVAAMLGSRPGATVAELRSRLSQSLDPAPIEAALARDRTTLEQLQSDDDARLAQLVADVTTPALVLIDAKDHVVARWAGEVDVAAVVQTVEH